MKTLLVSFLALVFLQIKSTGQLATIKNESFQLIVNNSFWQQASENNLAEKQRIDESVTRKKLNYIYLFYKKGQEFNSIPNLVVQRFITPNNFYESFKKKMGSSAINVILEKNKEILKSHLKDIKLGTIVCNDRLKTILVKAEIQRIDNLKTINTTLLSFSEKEIIQLVFSVEEMDFDTYSDQFNAIINSFKRLVQ